MSADHLSKDMCSQLSKDFARQAVGSTDTLCPMKHLYVACCKYTFTLTSPYKNIPHTLFVLVILCYLQF